MNKHVKKFIEAIGAGLFTVIGVFIIVTLIVCICSILIKIINFLGVYIVIPSFIFICGFISYFLKSYDEDEYE